MRPVFSYSGGKQRIASDIIRLFPKGYEKLHYIEPFAGGLAVLFKKNRSKLETISDKDKNVYNFYKILRERPDELKTQCYWKPYGKNEMKEAQGIFRQPEGHDDLKRAWAFWVMCVTGFRGNPRSSVFQIIKVFQHDGKKSKTRPESQKPGFGFFRPQTAG